MSTTAQPEGTSPPTVRTQLHHFEFTVCGRPTTEEVLEVLSEDLTKRLKGAVASGYATEIVKFTVFRSENDVIVRAYLSAIDVRDILPPR